MPKGEFSIRWNCMGTEHFDSLSAVMGLSYLRSVEEGLDVIKKMKGMQANIIITDVIFNIIHRILESMETLPSYQLEVTQSGTNQMDSREVSLLVISRP
jgi:hypothetical protein